MRVASRVLLSVGTIAVHVLVSFQLASLPGANQPLVTVPVVVASRDFAQGDRIDRTDVLVAHWPAGTVPAGAYSSIDQVAGLVTGTPVFRGEAIIPRRLARSGKRPSGYTVITPGKRAMSFRVNDISVTAGLIQPNSRVDLVVVMDAGERGKVAKLFMENSRVLAIGTVTGQNPEGISITRGVVTVEVTPDEGEKLAIVLTKGDVRLVLRNPAGSYAGPDVDAGSTVTVIKGVERAPVPFPSPAPARAQKAPGGSPIVRHAAVVRS